METNIIFNEDCVNTLDRMEDNVIDLTITSPPYNVDMAYNTYKDNKEYSNYLQWLKGIFTKLHTKTKSGGRCVINIGDQQNGRIPVHSDIIQMMKGIGWLPFANIIWDKNTISRRTSWGSWLSPSAPCFPITFEYIMVFAKDSLKLQHKGETDLTKEEFIKWSLAKWTIIGESSKKVNHPAAFPLEIPTRCIKMLSYKSAIVYDPFSGSGTTCLAAKILGRQFIGSEIDKVYYENSQNRIGNMLDYKE